MRAVIKDFLTPSERNQDPHSRGATGAWHSLLGLQISLMLMAWPWTLVAVLVAYCGKELHDIYKGGCVADSFEDVSFVLAGVALGFAIGANIAALVVVTAINVGCLWVMAMGHNQPNRDERF
jgi:hypothetical protein